MRCSARGSVVVTAAIVVVITAASVAIVATATMIVVAVATAVTVVVVVARTTRTTYDGVELIVRELERRLLVHDRSFCVVAKHCASAIQNEVRVDRFRRFGFLQARAFQRMYTRL